MITSLLILYVLLAVVWLYVYFKIDAKYWDVSQRLNMLGCASIIVYMLYTLWHQM